MHDDPVEKGLAEAFGGGADRDANESTLQGLERRAGRTLGLHLDSHGPGDAPVRVTEEARRLRDPSGRYQVLGEIGRGGVGVVYRGRDHDLGRDIALKVLKDEFATSPEVLSRFVEEAQIGGQLQHPGIVPVYDLGLHSGERPYFAMKLVKGETLAAQLARRADPAEDRRRLLGVFEQVCQTVGYAHARRVVHRDLKPGNVMIGAFGEVQVVDWGFAKVLAGGRDDRPAPERRESERSVIETLRSADDSGPMSTPGSMMGTPAYMPPEQARGDTDHVDRRSDVFALGAILCEILTGAPPYRVKDGDLVRQAANAELDGALARLRACGADASLVALCEECLAPARQARPESAKELAERVADYLHSVEERARRAELDAAEARYRHRTTALVAVAAVVVLALGGGGWIWVQDQAQERRAEASGQVASAVDAANAARATALAEGGGLDPVLWNAAAASALQAAELAASDDVDEAVGRRAEQLLATVLDERDTRVAEAERLDRDDAMRARLELLRIPTDDNLQYNAGWAFLEAMRLDRDYAAAFAAFLGGDALLDLEPDDALPRLADSGIAIELATAIDHWALSRALLDRPGDAPGTDRLRTLAERLDPGFGPRSRLRAILADLDEYDPELVAFAEEVDPSQLTPAGCRVLNLALWQSDAMDVAAEVLLRAREVFPSDFELAFHHALQLEQTGRSEEALAAYDIAHALRPEHVEVGHRTGINYNRLGRHEEEMRVYRRMARQHPDELYWTSHLAHSLLSMGRTDEALAALLEAGAREDADVAGLVQIASSLHDYFGDRERAVAHLDRALTLEPDDLDALSTRTRFHIQALEPDEAENLVERMLALDGEHAVALVQRGHVLTLRGESREAVEWYERAARAAPYVPGYRNLLGKTWMALGDLEQGLSYLERAVDLKPQDSHFHVDLGNAYWAAGRKPQARVQFERANQVRKGCSHAQVALGLFLADEGEVDAGVALIRQAIANGHADPLTRTQLAHALMKAGALEQAATEVEIALSAAPEYPYALAHLAAIQRREGLLDEAIATYEKIGVLLAELEDQDATDAIRNWRSAVLGDIEELRREQVVRGEREATTPEEWAEAVTVARNDGRDAELVALWEEAFESDPRRVEELLWGAYDGAAAAARLAQAEDPELDDVERARLRGLAREWLAWQAGRWEEEIATSFASTMIESRVEYALEDEAFAALRGDALAALGAEEGAAWRALWERLASAAGG